MGFLDSIFKRYPKREEWHQISQSITEGFRDTRSGWFNDVFVKMMQDFVQSMNKSPIPMNTELTDEVDRLMKAFQLRDISGFLAAKKYLPASQGRDFCDLFWAQVCGADRPVVS